MAMFELHYEPFVIRGAPTPWSIAVVPWDTETFGFGVSDLRPCYAKNTVFDACLLEDALTDYASNQQVALITTSISSDEHAASFLLQQANFRFIDLSLRVHYESCNPAAPLNHLPALSVFPAAAEDIDTLVDMAGNSFQHGRYHQDNQICRSLADQRYRDWIRRCLHPDNAQEILTVKTGNSICGFSIVELKKDQGYLHLHAIDSQWRGKKFGYAMIIQSLNYLYQSGAKSVDTKISASNLGAVNMHSRLNGHFTAADYLLHWHWKEKKTVSQGKTI